MDFLNNKLWLLTDRGVKVSLKEEPTNSFLGLRRNRVFWPVVPSPSLSIIHLAFVNCLRLLMKYGFDVYVLIYDLHYMGRVRSEDGTHNEDSLKTDVNHFIAELKKAGLKSRPLNKVKYAYESNKMKGSYYKYYSLVSSEIKLGELIALSEKYSTTATENKSIIRMIKPISIIAFVTNLVNKWLNSNIAMTLCGEDEEALFQLCHKVMKNINSKGYVPSQIFIPKFIGFEKTMPGVKDQKYFITKPNKQHLIEMARGWSPDLNRPDDPLLFIINHNLFEYEGEFKPSCSTGKDRSYDLNMFIKDCDECEDINACVLNALYDKIFPTAISK